MRMRNGTAETRQTRNRPARILALSVAVGLLAFVGAATCKANELFPPGPPAATLQVKNTIINADLIRVGISDDAMTAQEYPATKISATGAFTMTDRATGAVVFNGTAQDAVTVTVDKTGFTLKTAAAPLTPQPLAGPIAVAPTGPASRLRIMNITRRKEIPEFRGTFEIVRGYSSPAKLSVVNVVTLEDYLKAVVPNELPMRYGEEAVKAQAVAARNYAIRPREKPWPTFDICDSQYCQVYLGAQTETPGSNRVIADTEGLVAVYQGEPVLALFSSSHGGYAEDYSFAFSDPKTKQFPAPPIPYLSGGPDVPMNVDLTVEANARAFWTNPNAVSYDVNSPLYRWSRRWTRSELEATLNKGLLAVSKDTTTKDFIAPLFRPGDSIGTFQRANVLRRGKSGKAMVVEIVGTKGKWTIQKEFLIRKVFATPDGKMLPSGNVVFSHLTDPQGNLTALLAQGGGFGHGVGLSQLGASWMSGHGYAFPAIIRHYYKGASLGSMPITVGPETQGQAVKTSFRAKEAKGTMWVQLAPGESTPGPVTVQVNGRDFRMQPTGIRTGAPVGEFLKAQDLNTLVLYPDAANPNRAIRAWIELYPPKTAQ